MADGRWKMGIVNSDFGMRNSETKLADIAEKISRIEWGAQIAAGTHMYTARQMTEELKNLFKTVIKK